MIDKQVRVTLGACLDAVYRLARGRYGPQEEWFAVFFQGYHAHKVRDLQQDPYTSQSTVSRVMRDQIGMPKPMYAYYVTYDDMLRQDVVDYLADAIVSARQHQDHMTTLRNLVDRSNNLLPKDKAYILDYNAAAEADQLAELLYRMLVVLIREPIAAAA